MLWRAAAALFGVSLLSLKLSTCRSPGEGGKGADSASETPRVVELAGVDTSKLTAREKREWSAAVGELLAPCPSQPVNLAQCVQESRDCKTCAPAAEFLARQVQKGRTRAQMETAFKKRFAVDQVKEVPSTAAPSKGPDSAPVLIVEWADFQCGFCARTAPLLENLFKRYPDQIKVVFKNYPLSAHKHAEGAARAALAAGRQGKFWEMHAALFKRHPDPPDKRAIAQLVKDLGLDAKKFEQDVKSEAIADMVARDRKQGDALDLKGTPLIYINGRHFDLDHFDIGEDLEPWIKLEIKLKTGKKVEARPIKKKSPATPPSGSVVAAPSGSPPTPAGSK